MAAPTCIVLNPGSGRNDEDPERIIADEFRVAGRDYELLRITDPERVGDVAKSAVDRARRHGGIVVAAGGDGTLNAVAHATLGSGCRFGVIPQGTFNYFARTHGIPTDTTAAVRALLTAREQRVPVGLVNDRTFLVNASLGLYPETLELREEQKQQHGRTRLVAAWATLLSLFQDYRPLHVRIDEDDGSRVVSTLTLFLGLNRLQLEQTGLEADAPDTGRLAAVVLRPVSRAGLLWLLVRGAMGRLGAAHGVDSFATTSLVVTPLQRRVRQLKVAMDGETTWLPTPIEFRIAPEPLRLMAPAGDDR